MGGKSSKAKKKSSVSEQDAETISKISFEDANQPKTANGKPAKKENGTPSPAEPAEAESSSPSSPQDDKGKKVPKSIASRLTVPAAAVDDDTTADSSNKPKATKLFEAPKGPEHSKIYKALNPQKLYYESRREKAEAEEDKEVIVLGQRDFGFLKDAEGNIIKDDDDEDEEEEEEEDYDPDNLPDFGEFQEEMDKMRAERAKKQEERRRKLREEYEAKKAAEEQARQQELARIQEKEAKLKASMEVNEDDFVDKARDRLERETSQHLRRFSFKD
ncbi:hypothetical protein PTSG_08279 [Salpingoeca rosetta]|uniref:Uncharacterized protein n=1 Tax=Salpingoeca rosetta (strain ATCC 50818 / BSB-021) TaxID=946362 RepID=F2UJ87_SALR5|nr:uncharacterized protein PTSG_08279 [Salpingoeca rosetta]EGD77186.1 hypothetical protein PTSG_08279 [Salpingoeca rosetta]|eukprot:XP_004990530.1 hypothetical protein PTSG_08279 [Salpingoeca rosetta]